MSDENYSDDYKFATLCDAILAAVRHDEAYCMCNNCHTKRVLAVEGMIASMLDAKPAKQTSAGVEWARSLEVTRKSRVR